MIRTANAPRPPRPEAPAGAAEGANDAGDALASDGPRRPRIAIMGEFSAGKSTLTNLLMGADALPVKVTATQLPPVWMSHGDGAPHGVALDGARFDVNLDRPADIPLSTTQYLRVQREAEVLQICDLIDFPGISDPNMSAEVWDRAAPLADAVLWCTHATQAWRQTEAAFWQEMPEPLHARSLLLLTRMDKVAEPRDRRRLLSRVAHETEGLFAGIYPVSLTRALAAGEDSAAFEESGASTLMEALLDLVMRLSRDLGREIPVAAPSATRGRTPDVPRTAAETGADRWETAAPGRIVPRRVTVKGGARRQRPPAPAGEAPHLSPVGP
jgi:hypothetical protein